MVGGKPSDADCLKSLTAILATTGPDDDLVGADPPPSRGVRTAAGW